jgi:hypothetical protein
MAAVNGHDPLRKYGSDPQKQLFDSFTKESNNFATADVLGAAANLIVNALRQAHATKQEAGVSYDELAARLKGLLMEHYDAAGKRRSVFPFNQVIDMAHFTDREKF